MVVAEDEDGGVGNVREAVERWRGEGGVSETWLTMRIRVEDSMCEPIVVVVVVAVLVVVADRSEGFRRCKVLELGAVRRASREFWALRLRVRASSEGRWDVR